MVINQLYRTLTLQYYDSMLGFRFLRMVDTELEPEQNKVLICTFKTKRESDRRVGKGEGRSEEKRNATGSPYPLL